MDPSCQKGPPNAGGGSMTVWAVLIMYGLCHLVQLKQLLAGNGYFQLLRDHLQSFLGLNFPNNVFFFG